MSKNKSQNQSIKQSAKRSKNNYHVCSWFSEDQDYQWLFYCFWSWSGTWTGASEATNQSLSGSQEWHRFTPLQHYNITHYTTLTLTLWCYHVTLDDTLFRDGWWISDLHIVWLAGWLKLIAFLHNVPTLGFLESKTLIQLMFINLPSKFKLVNFKIWDQLVHLDPETRYYDELRCWICYSW